MKIAILSPFYPYRGGIAQFSAMLYTALSKEHEVKAFSYARLYPGWLFPGKTQYVEEGDSAIQVPAERVLDSINPFSYQVTANKIADFQPDVLILIYWMSFFAPALGHVASRLKKKTKVISLVHNAIPHEPKIIDKPFAKLLFNRVKGFVVMSETVRKDLLSMVPDARCLLKPHPLYDHFGEKIGRDEAIATLGLAPGKKNLLFFGLIRDYKGLDLLIDSLSGLTSEYQLIIAGESYGSFDKYEKQLAASPAKDRVKVMNHYIDDSLVPILFSAADLLVLPYKSATQSGVIPVAYHFEIPVLVTDVGGLGETIEVPETGLVCAADPKSIAHGIQRIFEIGTPVFCHHIRKEKKNLSWDVFAEEVISFAKGL